MTTARLSQFLAVLCVLSSVIWFAGCSSPIGRGSRILPWNWFSPDRATQLQNQQAKTDQAEDHVTAAAHRDLGKTVRTLEADPAPNKFTVQALRFGRQGLSLLDQVQPIAFADQQADTQLVLDLLSENAQIRAAAAKRQAADEAAAGAIARDLADSKQREGELTTKLEESDKRYQAQAEQSRRTWFVIYAVIAVFVLGNVLRLAVPFVPALAGVSKVVGAVVNPAAEFALHRAQAGLEKVGHAVAAMKDKLSPELSAQVVTLLDQHTDADTQRAIGSAANTAPRN